MVTMAAQAMPTSMRVPADVDAATMYEALLFLREQVRALQEQNQELHDLLRRLVDKEAAKAAPAKFRRGRDGGIQIWAGEGTGWISYDGSVDESLLTPRRG
jgi:hypothetical protein